MTSTIETIGRRRILEYIEDHPEGCHLWDMLSYIGIGENLARIILRRLRLAREVRYEYIQYHGYRYYPLGGESDA